MLSQLTHHGEAAEGARRHTVLHSHHHLHLVEIIGAREIAIWKVAICGFRVRLFLDPLVIVVSLLVLVSFAFAFCVSYNILLRWSLPIRILNACLLCTVRRSRVLNITCLVMFGALGGRSVIMRIDLQFVRSTTFNIYTNDL